MKKEIKTIEKKIKELENKIMKTGVDSYPNDVMLTNLFTEAIKIALNGQNVEQHIRNGEDINIFADVIYIRLLYKYLSLQTKK